MTTNAVFLAILGFFKGALLFVIQKKGFQQFERCFARFFPQKTFFSFENTLGFCHFLSFFPSIFPFNIQCFSSSTPFETIFSFCFFGSIFVAPFRSSFLLLSFQPVSCHPLLQSTLLSFFFFRSSILPLCMILFSGLAFPFSLVGFCLFLSDCCCHFSSLRILCLVFLSVVFC